MELAAGNAMRSVYGAIFIGCAVVGFAGVLNAHNPARAATASQAASDEQMSTAQPAPDPSSISIRTDFVHAEIFRPQPPPAVQPIRRASHRGLQPPQRSGFARVLFGDGQFRPQPFPTPAKN
jgi:hypothetical protein